MKIPFQLVEREGNNEHVPKHTQNFFKKNIVGVIVFSVFIILDLLRSRNIASLIIDIPLGLIIASIIQLLFNGLRKIL